MTASIRRKPPESKVIRTRKFPPVFPPLPCDSTGGVRFVDGCALIPYHEAYNVLSASLSGDGDLYDPSLRQELPAIVTHWLHCTGDNPLMMPAGEGGRWRGILSEYSGTQGDSEPARAQFKIDFSALPFPPVENPAFHFVDLFAGIGGFRIALQRQGGACVFSSEWDKHAKNTYAKNYGEVPFGDITRFTERSDELPESFSSAIPKHTILAGGFPCQAFSQAGRQLGFNDARGTLFFELLKIVRRLEPEVLFLENVKRLKTHDGGKTFKVIVNSLGELGYKVYAKVLRAYDFGVPQNRERIFIVAFKKAIHFEFPTPPKKRLYKNVGAMLEKDVSDYYTISDRLYAGHLRRHKEHRIKGNGFGFSMVNEGSPYTNTLSARYWKDGSEILIEQAGANPRMLTPRECARLQGYPDHFLYNDSHTQAYKQFGNSVAVPVITAIAEAIMHWRAQDLPAESLIDPREPVIL